MISFGLIKLIKKHWFRFKLRKASPHDRAELMRNKFYFLGLYRYVSGNPTGILLAARLDATPPVVAPGSTTDGWMYFTVSEVVRLNAGDEVGMSMTHMVPTNASTSLNLVGYIGPYYNEENSVSLAAYQIA